MLDISGKSKAKVLAALYNNSRPLGMGFFHYNPADMTEEEAEIELEESSDKYFDYLHGRVMKVDLRGNSFDPRLYDRDNGAGAAAKAIEGI